MPSPCVRRQLVRPAPPWHVGTMRAAVVLAFVVVARAPAAAHMVVLPAVSEAGGWERYALLVPTEKDSPTVRVELRLPMGMEVVAVEAKGGWQARYDPLPIGAATVHWAGGRIPPGQMMSFDFMAWNPPAPHTMTWQATQWYEDGSSDQWGGGDRDRHASTTTLRPADAAAARGTRDEHARADHHAGAEDTHAARVGGRELLDAGGTGGPSLAIGVALSSMVLSLTALVMATRARRAGR